MRLEAALIALAALFAAPAPADDSAPPAPPPAPPTVPRPKKPIEPRKFAGGKLVDPYWGATYEVAGLEEKPGKPPLGKLFDGKSGRVQIEIAIFEHPDELGAKARRDAEKRKWDAKPRAMKDVEAGDDPAPWVTFEEQSPSGGMRKHGYAWFARGCRAFVVHAHAVADVEGASSLIRSALAGLTVGPETGAAIAVETVSREREMPYDDAGVLAAAAEHYLRPDFESVTRPAIAEDLLKRAIANLPGSPIERNALGVMKIYENLVVAEVRLKKYDEAIAAGILCVEKAGKTDSPGPDTANANYNLACAYSVAGKLDEAFAALAKAFERFPPVPDDHLAKDTDLDNCRKDPRWAKFIEARPKK